MNAREKNQVSANPRQAKLRKLAQAEDNYEYLKTLPAAELKKQLTKKNQEYIANLKRALINESAGKIDKETAEQMIDPLLAQIVSTQDKGETAKKIFGLSPSQLALKMLTPDKETTAIGKWQYFTVASLAFLAIFALLAGVYELTEHGNLQQAKQIGWLTIAVLAPLMGYLATRYKELAKAKIKQSHLLLWSIMSLIMVGVVIWILQLAVVQTVNIYLPAPVYLIIAIAAILLLIFTMRRYKIDHVFFEDRKAKNN